MLVIMLMLSACSSAQTRKPSDIVGPDTNSACIYGVISDQLNADIEAGKMQTEGTLTTVGNSIIIQSLTEGLMLLRSGRADVLWCLYPTAQYIAARNPELQTVLGVYPFSLSMLTAPDRQELIDTLNRGLEGILGDGTMDRLWADHVDAVLDADAESVPVTMPDIPDGTKLRVGVSGDIPPMDYIAVDGTPAGFNTTVLAELANREHFDIELVQIDSGARFAALASDRVDVFFWQTRMEGLNEESYAGDPETVQAVEAEAISCLTTIPYRTMYAGWLLY